jgi:hypothetical protein
MMDIIKGKIGNALRCVAPNHIVAVANDIYDETLEKYQSELNSQVNTLSSELDNISNTLDSISSDLYESPVTFGGLEIAPGPLTYKNNEYVIEDN